MQLNQLSVRPILKQEEAQYLQLMQVHHYLGAIPKIGETPGMWQLMKRSGLRSSVFPLRR